MFNKQQLRSIVSAKIETDEELGDQSGGSGHLGHVSFVLDKIEKPVQKGENWLVSYQYTIVIETEFTCYPDNPPYEYCIKKTITLNKEGVIIGESEKETL